MAALLDPLTHLSSVDLHFQKFGFWNTVARCFTSVFPLLSLPGDVAVQPFLGGFSPHKRCEFNFTSCCYMDGDFGSEGN